MKKSLVALVMAGCMIAPSMTAFAGTGDSSLPTAFVTWNKSTTSSQREKEDDTYHYIYNYSTIPLWVESRTTGGVNCTKGGHAIIPRSTERFITNYVYEWGYKPCWLRIYAGAENVSGMVSGLWSPDSVGSYPVANP